MEVCVNDIIVKSLFLSGHILDIWEYFQNLRKNNMRLNPAKCTFNLWSGKSLGFLISQGGIKANLEKKNTSYIKHAPPTPRSGKHKEVQNLTGYLVALRRFVSKLVECCLSFFDTFKGAQNNRIFI